MVPSLLVSSKEKFIARNTFRERDFPPRFLKLMTFYHSAAERYILPTSDFSIFITGLHFTSKIRKKNFHFYKN